VYAGHLVSRRLRWCYHGETRNTCRILVRKPHIKRVIEGSRRWGDNVMIDLWEYNVRMGDVTDWPRIVSSGGLWC
jgi:hypothetical protein